MAALWPDAEVEEGNLAFQISVLRKALGPEAAKWIETIPRHGYRFAAPVAVTSVSVDPMDRPDVTPPAPARHRLPLLFAGLLILAVAIVIYCNRTEPSSQTYAAPLPLTTFEGDEAAPTWSPTGKDLAFAWNGPSGKNWDIYVKQSDVEQPFRFTTDNDVDFSPAWSRDGHRIAFARQLASRAVVIVVKPYPDGPERKVAEARPCFMLAAQVDKILDWHPDGDHLIVSGLGGTCGLSAVSTTTGAITPVTTPPTASTMDIAPAVCSDGSTVAFMRGSTWPSYVVYTTRLSLDSKSSGAPQRLSSDERAGMWPAWVPGCKELVFSSNVATVDGSLLRAPISDPEKAVKVPGVDLVAMFPAVSPDGSIAYTTRPPFATGIQRLDLRSGSTENFAPSTYLQQMPAYSPDGSQVAFESERSGYREIWVSSADGAQLRRLTHFNGPAVQSPTWSPDSSRILFTVSTSGERSVYGIPSTGGTPQRLTPAGAHYTAGVVSKDGKSIYVSSNRSGAYEVWRIPASEGEAVQLTRGGGTNPHESPDGRYLYYVTRGSDTALWRLPLAGGPAVRLTDEMFHLIGLHVVEGGAYFVARPQTSGRAQDFQIRFYDVQTNRTHVVATVAGPLGWGLSVAPDRRTLLFARNDRGTFDLKVVRPTRTNP
jgi:Tol biopolymer transport system component